MAELVDVAVPTDQAEGTEMVVGTWFKRIGDAVTENEPLLEINTDKVTVEIAAPASGVLREILKPSEQAVEPGDVLARIEIGAATGAPASISAGAAPAKASTSLDAPAPAELTPAVRRLLAEHKLDASAIRGSGKGGRITVQDVEAHIAARAAAPRAGGSGLGPSRRVPHSAMRRSIAQHMVQSIAVAPQVTAVFEADLSAVVADRAAHQVALEASGTKLTYTAYFVRASVIALQAVPEVNSRWHDDALELFEDCNIGVATALPEGGLIVPIIHRAQTLDLPGIAGRLQDLTQRAREGVLTPADVQHGTFSISNHGVSGSLVASPIIIPQPQSAILGIGKVEPRPVVRERDGRETIEVRPMCYVTLTIDHRVLDGFQANAFLTRWVKEIEGWTREP